MLPHLKKEMVDHPPPLVFYADWENKFWGSKMVQTIL